MSVHTAADTVPSLFTKNLIIPKIAVHFNDKTLKQTLSELTFYHLLYKNNIQRIIHMSSKNNYDNAIGMKRRRLCVQGTIRSTCKPPTPPPPQHSHRLLHTFSRFQVKNIHFYLAERLLLSSFSASS